MTDTNRTRGPIESRERSADQANNAVQLNIGSDDPAWFRFVACAGSDPELFHPISVNDPAIVDAIAVCNGCPVLAQCRDRRYDLGASGVWGGVYYGTTDGTARPCKRTGCHKPRRGRTGYCGFEHEHEPHAGTTAGLALHRTHDVELCRRCTELLKSRTVPYDTRRNNPGARPRTLSASGRRVAE